MRPSGSGVALRSIILKAKLVPALLLTLALTACTPSSNPASGPAQPNEPIEPTRSAQSSASPYPDRHRHSASVPANNSTFDFYLLNLSWSPEFCSTHPSQPECSQHLTFTLHGLWPQNTDGTFPEHCSNAPGPADPSAFRDIYPDPSLLQHEWQTHGTCSGLAPEAFLQLARRAVHQVAIPQQLTTLHQPITMPPTTIIDLFTAANPSVARSSLAVTCGNNQLTSVEVCFTKDLHPLPCPNVRTCRATTIRIPPPTSAP